MRTPIASHLLFSLIGIVILIALAGCWSTNSQNTVISSSNLKVEEVNACVADADCILVDQGSCGGTIAINAIYLEKWEKHIQIEKMKTPFVVCAPSIPREFFEARCLQESCRALERFGHAYLEFSEKPVLDVPVNLTFNFSFWSGMSDVLATVNFSPQDGLVMVSGIPNWQGELRAEEGGRINLTVVAAKAGFYQIVGKVEAKGESQNIRFEDTVYVEIAPTETFYGRKPVNNWDDENTAMAIPADADMGLIDSELTIEPEPAIGQEFTVTYHVTPRVDLTSEQVYLQIGMSHSKVVVIQNSRGESEIGETPQQGLQVVSVEFPPYGEGYLDQLAWRGAIAKGQTVALKVVFKAVETGWGNIYGNLGVQAGGMIDQYIQDAIIAEIHVDMYRGYFTIPISNP
jgi:hypothetical protein